jgi:DNA-binding LytR/AlgR family response regulator
MKLRCVIIDDEPGAQYVLEKYIADLGYAVLASTCSNAIEAYHFIKNNPADVLLVDINMPQVDGFGLLDMVGDKDRPAIIFTTAYSDHALKGFEYGAIDYLHKPIRFERFVIAMEKAQRWCSTRQPEETAEHIEIKVNGQSRQLKISDILYIESFRNYIHIHLPGKPVLVLMTMTEIENKLPKSRFVRIHKSYLVNAAKISNAEAGKVDIAGTLLPVGKTYKKYLEAFLRELEHKD